ncbi:MAG: hypothetical protein ACRYG2_32240 [Janthinobacterium lividum]
MTVPEAAPVDEQDVDEQEAERAGDEARLRLRRGRWVTAAVAAALLVVVGTVALLGGFGERTDLLTGAAPGSVIATGPYEVTFDQATVEHQTSENQWRVVASGTARTTGGTSIAPDVGDSGFVFARSLATREVQPTYTVGFGTPDALHHLDNLTPGLPPVPWTVSFQFAADPGDTLVLAVFDQEYTTPYLFSTEKGWRPTRHASTLTLPLERLPEQAF